MTLDDYLRLMHFPPEWQEFGMLPSSAWISEAIGTYEPGNENASEHDRNGAFHYWLKQCPSKEQLRILVRLSFLDPDQVMADDVRRYIAEAGTCDDEIRRFLEGRSDA